MVIGVQGKIPVNIDIYFAGPDSTVAKNNYDKDDNDLLSNRSENNDNKEDGDYIMFVSGLECGSKLHSSNNSWKRKLLVDLLLGNNNSMMNIMILAKTKVQVRGSHGS